MNQWVLGYDAITQIQVGTAGADDRLTRPDWMLTCKKKRGGTMV